MPARESEAHYYIRKLGEILPDSIGKPLSTPLLNDFTVVDDYRYFNDVAQRVKEAYEIDSDSPPIPGLEPDPISPEELEKKQHNAIAATRSRVGAGAIMQVIVTTFNEDTSRSLYRFQRTGEFIPVIETDEPSSLYLRGGDYIDDLFQAATLERVVPSKWTREKGEKDLRVAFEQKKSEAVLPLSIFTGRNNARLREVWLQQLETTTQGYRYLPSSAKNELKQYILSRPDQYLLKPDMYKLLARIHRKNTGRYRRTV